ncbi:sodium/glutamate symporter [Leucobacter sp. wl10]|uniref:sodium/glutamate symporter n=1 Tax=Leucobacter sp. wl10 TaxID=2304677 RepID=UPI000E5BE605|nr:sodium:glutamate symporter [Leucobacter sp. wl10]RGE19407.1 sodium:glutamate symporter [Leucobacter sp. wl10]
MEFSPWTLLVDAGLIGVLLVFGTLLRAKIKALQTMMIPAGVIAGIAGLILGPNVLGWLPFSDQLGTYTSILIAVVFACLALTSDFNLAKIGRSVASFASYGVLMYGAQVAIGMLLALALLGPLLGAPDYIGIMLFAGWAGGFGSAAAVGAAFADAGDPAVASIGFTAATVGLMIGVVGGIAQAKLGAVRGHAKEFAGAEEIPRELRTGVLDHVGARPPIGLHLFSGGTIESLTFQIGLVASVSTAAYGVNLMLGQLIPGVAFPLFTIAFIVGLMLRGVLTASRATRFIDKESINSLSGTATDILMVCGIASVVPSLVADQWLSLVILFVIGLALCLFLGFWVAPRVLGDGWYERQLFTWGWSTGAVATGIALLRIVDPKLNSRTLEDFSVAYLPVLPVEITAVTFVPLLVIAGASWSVVGIWGAIMLAALIASIYFMSLNKRTAATTAA